MSETPVDPAPQVTLTVSTVNKDESYTSVPLDLESAHHKALFLDLGEGVLQLDVPNRPHPVHIAAVHAVTWFLTDVKPEHEEDEPKEDHQDEGGGRPFPHPGKGPRKRK